MHREHVGLPEQLVLLDPLDPLLGGLLGGQVLAPGDRLHAEGDADARHRAAEPAEAEAANGLAGHAVADTGLPAALAHERVVLGDTPGRAEDEAPGELGGVLIAAARPAGAAHGDPASLQRLHVERGVAHPGGDQQLQLWQLVDDLLGEHGALAHRADDLAVGERAHARPSSSANGKRSTAISMPRSRTGDQSAMSSATPW